MKNPGYSKGGGKPQDLGPKCKALKHKHKHLGGKGLSLPAFSNAKTIAAFNPAGLRKQKEYYKNAKNVKKYRDIVKLLEDEGHMYTSGSIKEAHNLQKIVYNRLT